MHWISTFLRFVNDNRNRFAAVLEIHFLRCIFSIWKEFHHLVFHFNFTFTSKLKNRLFYSFVSKAGASFTSAINGNTMNGKQLLFMLWNDIGTWILIHRLSNRHTNIHFAFLFDNQYLSKILCFLFSAKRKWWAQNAEEEENMKREKSNAYQHQN